MSPDLDQVITSTKVSVDDSAAVALPPTSQQDRQGYLMQNLGPNPVWVGGSTVTAADGIKVDINQTFGDDQFGPQVKIYGICATGQTADVRVMELS